MLSRTYSLTGAYRKWLVKPKNMSWHFKKYNTSTDNIILSDLEKLKGVSEPLELPDGKLKALIIDFCLPASVYATMALRELLRQETSPYSQSQLEKTLLEEASNHGEVVEHGQKRESTVDAESENIVKKSKMEEI
jgi:tRNA pseudouridine13 synthase